MSNPDRERVLFAALLAKMQELHLLTPEMQDELCTEMGVSPGDLDRILHAAQQTWKDVKENAQVPQQQQRAARTGYFLTPDGTLRHAHYLGDYDAPRWHRASEVHTEDPDAHTRHDSWSQLTTVWAAVNKHLSPDAKAKLIDAARITHDCQS